MSSSSFTLTEGSTKTLTFTVTNSGGRGDPFFLDVSHSDGLEITARTPSSGWYSSYFRSSGGWSRHAKGSTIYNRQGNQFTSSYELQSFENSAFPANSSSGLTLTVKAKDGFAGSHWLRYRVAMNNLSKNANPFPPGGDVFKRDPSSCWWWERDQQDYCARQISVTVKAYEPRVTTVETRDGNGSPKSDFRRNDSIQLRLTLDKGRTGTPLSWEVRDPANRKVDALSLANWSTPSAATGWQLPGSIPADAPAGIYSYTGTGPGGSASTTFTVSVPFQPPTLSTSSYVTPSTADRGSSLTAWYQITNPNTTATSVGLGASIRRSGTSGDGLSDPAHDLPLVTVQPGTHWYSRTFTTQASWDVGAYQWVLAIWSGTPGSSTQYDSTGWKDGLTLTAPPTLSNGSVSPSSGSPGAEFVYSVIYTDADNNLPNKQTISVDGGPQQTMWDTDFFDREVRDGKGYRYSTTLSSLGSHSALVRFNDGQGSHADVTLTIAGPEVVNQPPTLSSGSVTPPTGSRSTSFHYEVTYTDVENNPPTMAAFDLTGLARYPMKEKWSWDDTYTDGKDYVLDATLPLGNHTGLFRFNDGQGGHADVTLAVTGPIVENRLPSQPAGPSPAHDATGIDPRGPTLSWNASTDADGDQLSYQVRYRRVGDSFTDWIAVASRSYPIPQTLQDLTEYDWQVRVTDSVGGFTDGPVWRFTTKKIRGSITLTVQNVDWSNALDVPGANGIVRLYQGSTLVATQPTVRSADRKGEATFGSLMPGSYLAKVFHTGSFGEESWGETGTISLGEAENATPIFTRRRPVAKTVSFYRDAAHTQPLSSTDTVEVGATVYATVLVQNLMSVTASPTVALRLDRNKDTTFDVNVSKTILAIAAGDTGIASFSFPINDTGSYSYSALVTTSGNLTDSWAWGNTFGVKPITIASMSIVDLEGKTIAFGELSKAAIEGLTLVVSTDQEADGVSWNGQEFTRETPTRFTRSFSSEDFSWGAWDETLRPASQSITVTAVKANQSATRTEWVIPLDTLPSESAYHFSKFAYFFVATPAGASHPLDDLPQLIEGRRSELINAPQEPKLIKTYSTEGETVEVFASVGKYSREFSFELTFIRSGDDTHLSYVERKSGNRWLSQLHVHPNLPPGFRTWPVVMQENYLAQFVSKPSKYHYWSDDIVRVDRVSQGSTESFNALFHKQTYPYTVPEFDPLFTTATKPRPITSLNDGVSRMKDLTTEYRGWRMARSSVSGITELGLVRNLQATPRWSKVVNAKALGGVTIAGVYAVGTYDVLTSAKGNPWVRQTRMTTDLVVCTIAGELALAGGGVIAGGPVGGLAGAAIGAGGCIFTMLTPVSSTAQDVAEFTFRTLAGESVEWTSNVASDVNQLMQESGTELARGNGWRKVQVVWPDGSVQDITELANVSGPDKYVWSPKRPIEPPSNVFESLAYRESDHLYYFETYKGWVRVTRDGDLFMRVAVDAPPSGIEPMTLSTVPTKKKTGPGQPVPHYFVVNNFAAETRNYDLRVVPTDLPAGWTATVDQSLFTLTPYTSKFVTLTVTPPSTVKELETGTVKVDAYFYRVPGETLSLLGSMTFVTQDDPPPIITTNNGQDFVTNNRTVVLEGTAASLYTSILVNGSDKFVRYNQSTGQWRYENQFGYEGEHTFVVTGRTQVGTISDPATIKVTYDATAPTVKASPTGGTFVSPPTVTLTASEPGAIYYTTDGSVPTPSSTRYADPIVIDRTTTLSFVAIDAAGNASALGREVYTLTVPQQPPVTSIDYPAEITGKTGLIPVRISGTKQSFETLIRREIEVGDRVIAEPGATTWSYTAMVNVGDRTIIIGSPNVERLIAQAGGRDSLETVVRFTPKSSFTLTATPPGGRFNQPIAVALAADQIITVTSTVNDVSSRSVAYTPPVEAIYYTTDGIGPTINSTKYRQPIPVDRTTTINFLAVGAVGHTSPVSSAAYVVVPQVSASPPGGWYEGSVTVTLTSSVPDATIYYSIDGEVSVAPRRYTDPLTFKESTTLRLYAELGSERSETVVERYVVFRPKPVASGKWTMISLAGKVSSVSDLGPDVTVKRWNSATRSYEVVTGELVPWEGYWVRSTTGQPLKLPIDRFNQLKSEARIDAAPGFLLLPSFWLEHASELTLGRQGVAKSLSEAIGAGWVQGRAYWWDESSGRYRPLDLTQPFTPSEVAGRSYWLQIYQPFTLSFTGLAPQAVAGASPQPNTFPPSPSE